MKKDSKIYVAGHTGLVGSAIIRKLTEKGFGNIVAKTIDELDLTRQQDVEDFFADEKPEYVFLAAARVGGIGANATYPAEFIYQNIAISFSVIHSAFKFGVKKLCNLGSSCIYPKLAPQPLKEEYFMSGKLEPTNEAYAIAKIASIKLCRYYNQQYKTNFISVMPTNLFGPGDNYNPDTSHVIPALIRKIHDAKITQSTVRLWGDGSPYREFLFSDDLADALFFLMKNYSASDIGEFINIGTGKDLTIKTLAELVAEIIDFRGNIEWDTTKPIGTPRKLLDVSKMDALGWKSKTSLEKGLRISYDDFLERYA